MVRSSGSTAVQGRSEIRIKCDHLLLSIAKWKNDPYAGAEFVVLKQSILAAMERYKKGAGPLPGLPTSTTRSNHRQIRTLTAGRRSGPGRRIRGGEGGGELPSYPNIVPITDSQDQRLYWTYRDAWVEAGADGSFAGALMIRNHHPATS